MSATLVTNDIETPELDPRSYKIIRLENDLEVLLVHDPDTDKASAALDVHVGHLSDPWDAAGLAHFCEHLLFMGTEKYPAENDYSEFLSAHNGSSNAYTGTVDTNYFFDVGHEHLEPALDRFSQFFISPLFLETCKDRELLAVDSENKKNLQNDMWRAYQLEKSLSNPEHVYSKFGTGNLETLKIEPEKLGHDVRNELLKFHQELYSANQMKLVLLGRHDLDELEQLAIAKFSQIVNKKKIAPSFQGEILRKGHELGAIYTFKPVKEVRNLELCFPIPECDPFWRSQPSHYISHLIGHEGQGSILSYLKKQGWVLYLGAGGSNASPGTDFFKINMELTLTGCQCWQRIVEVIFAYINILKKEGIQKWIFEELRLTSEAQFRYKERSPASRFTSSTAGKLHSPIEKRYILGSSIPREFRREEIEKVLDALNYENFRVALADPALTGECETEKYYGTSYRLERLPKDLLQNCSPDSPIHIAELHLPIKNNFIPENFDTHRKDISSRITRPTLIKSTDMTRLWHKKDDTFWVPKANYLFLIRNPYYGETAINAVMTKLFIELLKDGMNEFAYNADIAGLQYSMDPTVGAFTLTFSGYNDKMPVLIETVLRKMKSLKIDPDRFSIEKDRLERDLSNFDFEAPYTQVSYHMNYVLAHLAWTKAEQSQALSSLKLDDFQQFVADLFRRFHVEILAHGNITRDEAMQTSQLMEDILLDQDPALDNESRSRSVILLKTKSIPKDPYESIFIEHGYNPYFVPVLDHAMTNLDALGIACGSAPTKFSGLIVTSQRSVEAIGSILPGLQSSAQTELFQLPIYTVGPATCRAIQNLGFTNVQGSECGNGDALASYILAHRSPDEKRPLFFAVGDKRRDIITKRMAAAGIVLEEMIVYETISAATFSEDLKRVLEQVESVDWLVFFSPAGADIALDYIRSSKTTTKIATIGPTTEDYLVKQWQVIPTVVSRKPDPQSLVSALLDCAQRKEASLDEEDKRAHPALWLPLGSHSAARTLKDPSNTNSCIEYFLQFGPTNDIKIRALGSLFAQICSEPAFNQLRTKEQLGYIVFSGVKITLTSNGFRILIQSEKTSDFLASRIDAFLDFLDQFLLSMKVDDFERQKVSLIDKLNEKLKNLAQETKRYWTYISSSQYNFDELDELTTQLRGITKDQIVAFFKEFVHYSGGQRRHFSMAMEAQSQSSEEPSEKSPTTNVTDIEAFKSSCRVMDRPCGQAVDQYTDHAAESKL